MITLAKRVWIEPAADPRQGSEDRSSLPASDSMAVVFVWALGINVASLLKRPKRGEERTCEWAIQDTLCERNRSTCRPALSRNNLTT